MEIIKERISLENEIVPVSVDMDDNVIVSARQLHEFLEIGTEFRKWFPRMIEYGFEEYVDYIRVSQKCHTLGGTQNIVDYALKIDMAKEICMIQRSEKGKQAREYFIKLEKKYNSPEAVLIRLLEMTQNNYSKLIKKSINIQNEIPDEKPTDYRIQSDLLTNFRDTAKLLGTRVSLLVSWLILNNYCYRDKKGAIKPMANSMEYFALREFTTENGHCGIQTLVNSRGRQVFKNLLMKEKVIKTNDEIRILN
ncbi:antA/AntB antirepressor family protein [Terrisporobacter sp.]|uniref:antA/AntB antirepressor family protein n=1 Tax=Terrisporobacter sp. TaxID=1965305 RepID=UPI002634A22E|nr:antA/AntB antirepressor family protein [Terrisporobacter sp.]